MMDVVLRPVKDAMLRPIAQNLGDSISPTTITLIAGGVGVLAALAGWRGEYTLGLILWWTNRFLDGLDGALARESGKQSELGGYIDTLIDFAMYTIIPVGLAMREPSIPLLATLVFLLGTFYVNAAAFLYLSAILIQRKQSQPDQLTSVAMPRGLVEGTEAIIIFTLFFLFPEVLGVLFTILGVLVIATTFQHIIWAVRNLPR